eukprot:841189-Rhodomonas_salina.1
MSCGVELSRPASLVSTHWLQSPLTPYVCPLRKQQGSSLSAVQCSRASPSLTLPLGGSQGRGVE